MRIGTWNVEYAAGKEKNARRLARLRQARADIWVLTETHDVLDLSDTHHAVSTLQRPHGRKGSRWVTIWSRWPMTERLAVGDPTRTVAARLDHPVGDVVVYGTVLPWHTDRGPHDGPVRNWSEQDRVLPLQLAEWRAMRDRLGTRPLVIAGDFNMNLGGPHYYGTKRGRKHLREGLQTLELACATEHERVPAGALNHPAIDHIVVPRRWLARTRVVEAWEGRTDEGPRLSDHSGLVIEVR